MQAFPGIWKIWHHRNWSVKVGCNGGIGSWSRSIITMRQLSFLHMGTNIIYPLASPAQMWSLWTMSTHRRTSSMATMMRATAFTSEFGDGGLPIPPGNSERLFQSEHYWKWTAVAIGAIQQRLAIFGSPKAFIHCYETLTAFHVHSHLFCRVHMSASVCPLLIWL